MERPFAEDLPNKNEYFRRFPENLVDPKEKEWSL